MNLKDHLLAQRLKEQAAWEAVGLEPDELIEMQSDFELEHDENVTKLLALHVTEQFIPFGVWLVGKSGSIYCSLHSECLIPPDAVSELAALGKLAANGTFSQRDARLRKLKRLEKSLQNLVSLEHRDLESLGAQWIRDDGVDLHEARAASLRNQQIVEVPRVPISSGVTPRSGLPPRLRYLVMQRDNFRCQLCGRNAQDGVKLEIDHSDPASRGGEDKLENLWTLCFDCNRGKSDLALTPE